MYRLLKISNQSIEVLKQCCYFEQEKGDEKHDQFHSNKYRYINFTKFMFDIIVNIVHDGPPSFPHLLCTHFMLEMMHSHQFLFNML